MQLLGVEFHGSTLEALHAQLLGQSIEHDELVGIFTFVSTLGSRWCGLTFAVDNAIGLQQLLHLLVGVAAIGADNGMHDAVFLHVGILIEVEDDTVTEFVLIGAQ